MSHRTLMPRSDGKTSVYRVSGLSEKLIWQIGDLFVRQSGGKAPMARADLRASTVAAAGLHVEPDDSPPRHANIAGWPPGKDARMSLALQLRAGAVLMLRN